MYKNRLTDKLAKLEILFDEDNCSEKKAKDAWYDFFQHDFWKTSLEAKQCYSEECCVYYNNTEQDIRDRFPVNKRYYLELECTIEADGFRPTYLTSFLRIYKWLPHNKTLKFSIKSTNAPSDCDIYWKVCNVGPEAKRRNCIRGEIIKTNKGIQVEHTSFRGEHYVECYLVKCGEVVAMTRVDVPIE